MKQEEMAGECHRRKYLLQVVSMEKELNSLRIEGQDLKGQVSALLGCLSRLSGETVAEGEGEGGEMEEGEKKEEEKTEGSG